MATFTLDLGRSEEVPTTQPLVPPQPAGRSFELDLTPSWEDAINSIPTTIASSIQQKAGGWIQLFGDIASKVYADSGEGLAKAGAGIAESGRINAELGVPKHMSTPQESVVSGVSSAAETLLLAPLGRAGVVAGMGLGTLGQTYGEMRNAGFGGLRSFGHALFEGGVESATEFLPAKALFGSHKNLLARTIAVMTREIPGELVATALQDASAKLSRNPNMTMDEFLHDLVVTAGATAVGVPIQAGAVHGALRLLSRPSPNRVIDTPIPDPATAIPPRYTDLGTEVKEVGAGIDTTNPTGWLQATETQKTKPVEGVELTPAVYAQDRYRRIQEAINNGTPTTPGDMLWARWYRDTNGAEVGSDLVVATPLDEIEKASQALENAAKDAPAIQTSDGGLIIPTVLGAQSTTRMVEPNNTPVARDLETSMPAGTVTKITGKESVRVDEPRTPALPKPDEQQKNLEAYNAAPKVELDEVHVKRHDFGDTWAYVVNGFVKNPARGNSYAVVSAGVSKDQLAMALGPAAAGVNTNPMFVDGGSAILRNVQMPRDFLDKGREHIVDKAIAIKQAIESHGIAIPGVITRAKSVSAVMPHGTDLKEQSFTVINNKAGTLKTLNAASRVGYKVYKDQHQAGEVVLTGEESLQALKMQKILQAWVEKYIPQARIVLIHKEGSMAEKNLGYMVQDNDGVYYINIQTKVEAATQYQTMAHEFGHVLLIDQFYKSPSQQMAAMFEQYHEFLKRVPTMTVEEFLRERFDMSWSRGFGVTGILPTDPASKVIEWLDDRGEITGYTLSFDEYFAEQFSKYVSDLNATEFAADPSVQSLMRAVYERLKTFFDGLSLMFREGKAFRQWVEGLALTNAQVKEAIRDGGKQNKIVAKLLKAGYDRETIDALKNEFGEITDEDVKQLLQGDVPFQTKPSDDVAKDANGAWEAALGQENSFSFGDYTYYEIGDKVEQDSYPGQPGEVVEIIEAPRERPGYPRMYRVRVDVRGHPEGVDENGEPVDFKLVLMQDDNMMRLNPRPKEGEASVSFPGLLASWAQRSGQPQVAEAVTKFGWWHSKFLSLLQIGQMNAHVPGVTQFVNGMRRMFATKARWTGMADGRIEEWRALGKEQSDKLSKLLLEEAEAGKFIGTVVQNGTSTREQTYTIEQPEAQRRGLNDAAVAMYTKIHSDYLAALNSMEINGIHELWRIYDPASYYAGIAAGTHAGDAILLQPAATPLLAQHTLTLQQDYARLRTTPYIPFTRFGRWAVLIKADEDTAWRGRNFKKGQTMYFATFESKGDRDKHANEMTKQTSHLPLMTVSEVYIKDEEYNMRGMPPALVDSLQARLELTTDQAKKLKDVLASMTSSRAFIQHMQKREGVFGYSEDVQRVYSDYFLRFANHQSRLEHGHELDKALDEIAKTSRAIEDAAKAIGVRPNTDKRDLLHEHLWRLREYVMKPKDELEDVRGALTVAYLAFNVKSAVINGFQVPFVTIPYLSSRSSWKTAMQETSKAYKDVLSSWTKPNSLSKKVWAFFQRALSDAWLDESFAATLANVAEGGNLLRALPTGRIGKGWEHVKTKGMWMFQRMEEVNRRVTALTAYRIALEQGMSDEQAYIEARTAVEKTQGEYAKWNRPEFMRGPMKSLMFMFMQYQQNMVFQMYGGDKSWLRLLGTHLAIAGLMGLPFVTNAKDLVKWLARMWGLRVDLEEDARRLLTDIGVNPDWVLRGASHNAFGVDLSGSLSMGRIVPGIEALAQEGKFSDRVLSGSTDISGAGVSFVTNVMQAIADDNPNTLLRFQRALPAALQNLSKGAEIVEHGGRIDKTGAVVAELGTSEAILQSLGFTPAKASSEMQEFHAKKQLALFWQTRRAALMEQYWYAGYIANDREGMADVRSAIREFNSTAPERSIAITHDDLSRSVKARQRAKLMREKGFTTQKRMHGLQSQMEMLYQTDER